MTFQDTLWLFLAGITGAVGACAIPYGIAAIERLARRRNGARVAVESSTERLQR